MGYHWSCWNGDLSVRNVGGAGWIGSIHHDNAGLDAPLCVVGAHSSRDVRGCGCLVGTDSGTRTCCNAEHIRAQPAAGARHDRPLAVRPHSLARATQGLVLSCVSTSNWTELLGSVEPCLALSLARGCMPDGHDYYASLAGTGRGADTNKNVSSAAFRFGHASCARRTIAAWCTRSNARFGLWGLPGHGARRNATGHAAYPMVLPCLCQGFRPPRLPCRARRRSAGRRPPDQLPMAATGWLRGRRSLARACGAVGITICPRPIPN